MAHTEQLTVDNMIQELLQVSIISASDSPDPSPILLVKKKNGKQRMHLNYRKLNSIAIKVRLAFENR